MDRNTKTITNNTTNQAIIDTFRSKVVVIKYRDSLSRTNNRIDKAAFLKKAHEVGKKMPNELGIFDMTGNVWEWCADGLRDYTEAPQIDPVGPVGAARVVRGGSWYDYARICRSASRFNFDPDLRNNDAGFRCARVLP